MGTQNPKKGSEKDSKTKTATGKTPRTNADKSKKTPNKK